MTWETNTGAVSGLFLAGYGTFRFLAEYTREPDAFLGYFFDGYFTMGQLLSLPMIVIGFAMMVWAYRQPAKDQSTARTPRRPGKSE